MPGGQIDWGGRLLKSNGGAQRSPQVVWKSTVECKGIRGLDCEADRPSRGGKPGPSDPAVLSGRAVDQRIKVTPGITG